MSSSQITFPFLKNRYEHIFKTNTVNHDDWEYLGRFTRDSMDTRCLCGFKIKNSNLFKHKNTEKIYNFGDGCRKNFGVPAKKYFNQTQKKILTEINKLVSNAFDLYKYFQINYKLYLQIQKNKIKKFLKKVIKNFKQNSVSLIKKIVRPYTGDTHRDAKLLLKKMLENGVEITFKHCCNNCNDKYHSKIPIINNSYEVKLNYYRSDVKIFCQTKSLVKNKKKSLVSCTNKTKIPMFI